LWSSRRCMVHDGGVFFDGGAGPPVRQCWQPPWRGIQHSAVRCRRPPWSGANPVWMPPYSWKYGARHRLAPSGGSWLCSESSRSGYIAIVHKYYLFSSPKHCIHKLIDVRNEAAKKQHACKAKKCAYSNVGMLKSMHNQRTQVA
jgi:hypothetical protein